MVENLVRIGAQVVVFFFKQKTAYEMRISDWSSDVCSSDLPGRGRGGVLVERVEMMAVEDDVEVGGERLVDHRLDPVQEGRVDRVGCRLATAVHPAHRDADGGEARGRSEEHTSELQSLMRLSYAVFCLKKKKKQK